MPHTFDSVLDDDVVTVINRNDSMGVFEVRIGDLETVVTIELGRFMDGDQTKFSVSHAIKTPAQLAPYRTSHPFADNAPYALHRAITGLSEPYRGAVRAGLTPSESWLVENQSA